MNSIALDKSLDFSVRIVNLYKHLTSNYKEYILSKQLLRSGTSIGANLAEAQRGYSRADFSAKVGIALKEANETEYWLKLLYRTEFINEKEFTSINSDLQELLSMLVRICKSSCQPQNAGRN